LAALPLPFALANGDTQGIAMKFLRLSALLFLSTISIGMAAAPKSKPAPLPMVDIPYTK
jgi:hypothetical protein